MALKSNQPKWDIYEAVVRLGGYLELLQTPYPRVRIIKRISRDLRTMAVNRGLEIGSIYRNENGISYQIRSMESAYNLCACDKVVYGDSRIVSKRPRKVPENTRRDKNHGCDQPKQQRC